MPDWIISITWNVYGADKDPKCTSCRSLRGRGREYFERSMKPILLERDNNLNDAIVLSSRRRQGSDENCPNRNCNYGARSTFAVYWAWRLAVMILQRNFPFDDPHRIERTIYYYARIARRKSLLKVIGH